MTAEELKKYYQTSWFSWFFFPAMLGRFLSIHAPRPKPGSADNHRKTTPWIDIANICQAFESVGPILRWIFKQSLGRFYDGQTYQRYSMLSPTLRNAAFRHVYLYMVFHAKKPERMAVLLEQFESKVSQHPESRLKEFINALNQADPILFTDLFSALQDTIQLPNTFIGDNTSTELTRLLGLMQDVEAAKQYAMQTGDGVTQSLGQNTDPIEMLSAWGFDSKVFSHTETLPVFQLSSQEKAQYMLDAFDFLHKINKTTRKNLVPVLIQAVVNHPIPEQAMMAWVLVHRRLFLWIRPDQIRNYAQKSEWTSWITRMRILQSEHVIDKLPRLIFDRMNRVGYQYSQDVQLESLTNIIVALQRINLLHVLLLPEIDTALENLNNSFYYKFNEMNQAFDELSQNDILTAENFIRLSSLFKAFGNGETINHAINIQNLKTTLITMKQKGILDTASMQDYLVYEPFLSARTSEIEFYDILVGFEPTLNVLYQLGLLDGEDRWNAHDLHQLNLDSAGCDDLFKRLMTVLVSHSNSMGEETRTRYLNIAPRILQQDRYAQGVNFRIRDTDQADETLQNTLDLYQSLLPMEKLPVITLLTYTSLRPLNSMIARLQSPQFLHNFTIQIKGPYGLPEEQWLYNALSHQTSIPVGLRVIFSTPGEQKTQMDQLCDKPFNDTVACLTFMIGISKNNHKFNRTPLELLHEIFSFVVGWHAPEPGRVVKYAVHAVKHRSARDTFFAEKTQHLRPADLDSLQPYQQSCVMTHQS